MIGIFTKLTGFDDIGSGDLTSHPSVGSRIGTVLAYVSVVGLGLAAGLCLAVVAALSIYGINC